VILAATSTIILNFAHSLNTGAYRKPSGVEYPNAYASAAEAKENPAAFAFNCAQRAHANFTEHHTSVVAALLVAGLRFPVSAAVCGFGWTVSRLFFMWGYSNSKIGSKGKGRYNGSAFWLFETALIGMAGWFGGEMVLGL
jgi:glutathione S-transferase